MTDMEKSSEVDALRKRVEELESQVFLLKELVMEMKAIDEMRVQAARQRIMFALRTSSSTADSPEIPVLPTPNIVHEQPELGAKFYIDSEGEN